MNSGKVFDVIKKVTELLLKSFPGVRIFPTVGNHDVWPAHQVPGDSNNYYENVFSLAGFDKLLGDVEKGTFLKGL